MKKVAFDSALDGAHGSKVYRKTLVAIALGAMTTTGTTQAQLEEIVVTATKRAESTQDIAVSIQAVTGDTMKELGIQTFDEYVEYLPNVVSAGNGPGQKEIYIRGSAGEQSSVTVGPAQGSAPGVALYLDEMPVAFGSRNLDIYAADLARVEVLAGPQGTLFGASSQSGTVRLITNKPKIGEFEARIDLGLSTTEGGGDSNKFEGMVNIPLSETTALRVVGYRDDQGGWIDNVASTFTPNGQVIDRNNSAGFGPFFGQFPQTNIQSASNAGIAEEDWNEATYEGVRVGFAWDINDDWSLLLQHTSQGLDVKGSFLIDPSLGDESSAKFSPERNVDDFGLTAWTLEGRIGNLDVVYTGGYLDREVDAIIDYTHYNNGGGYITYYLCSGNIYAGDKSTAVNNCFNPVKQYADASSNERTTHEIRFSTDQDKSVRYLGGAYFNDVETSHLGEFQYLSTNDAFSEHIVNYFGSGAPFKVGNTTIPNTAGTVSSGPRSPLTTFFNDFTRTEEEIAFFGEVAFDINEKLTASISGRYYDLESQLQGASNFSFGCRYGVPGIPGAPAGAGFGNASPTADGRCNSDAFSNDVTTRLQTLGQYNATGDDSLILNARAPSGTRDLFRGGGSNAATLAAIKNGTLDISDVDPDGSTSESDTIFKYSLDYKLSDDLLIYGIASEGYRPATQNRNAGQLAANQSGVYEGYVVPVVAVTDTLTNYEIGMKGDFADGRFRLNASLYTTEIENLQVSRFDPSNVAFLVFMENVGDAEATGLDLDFQWAATDSLTVTGAASFLDTEITRLNPQLQGVAVPVGSELPLAPSFSGNIRARYDMSLDFMGGTEAYLSAGLTHRGESTAGIVGSAEFFDDTGLLSYGATSGLETQNEGGNFGTVNLSNGSLPANTRFINESATTINLGAGISKDNWNAELFINNLTSEEGKVIQTAGKFSAETTTLRPRTIGVRFSYFFN
ncbi:MAG: iron complex outermembrane receptor protein [Cryomorphaceae bacterium]|jgi:iron complex outermembrane receptor protein